MLCRLRRGHVTLVFETNQGEVIHFRRTIIPSSGAAYASEYKIDGKRVPLEDYNALLEQQGVLVKARNCLVFQGDIENIAHLSPMDLTRLFEHISGSEACRQEYEEAEAKVKESDEKSAFIFARKKQITQERKQKKEQKEEAEKHLGLQKELEEVQTKHYLWQIYQLEKDMRNSKAEKERCHAALKKFRAHNGDKAVNDAIAARSKLQRERLNLETKIKSKRLQTEKKDPESIKVQEQIAHLDRRIKSGEVELLNLKRKAADQSSRVGSLEEQLRDLEDAQKALEAELAQGKARSKLKMSEALLKEYNAIKAEAGAQLNSLEADRTGLTSAQSADQQALGMLQDTLGNVISRIAEIEIAISEAKTKTISLKEISDTLKKDLHSKTAEKESVQATLRSVEANRERLTEKINESEDKLRDARLERKENDREARMTEAITAMRREIGGVHGRAHELAKVTNDKYNLAMAVAMGKDFDAVIVETEETAIRCIRYLKERRLPPVCFLPVASLRVKEIDDRLDSLGGSARLALRCLEPVNPNLMRVYQSICGNTLICNTVDEARQLAFGEIRRKVVALDGTLFNKAGIITGGVTQGLEAKANKWTKVRQAELDQMLAHHARLVQELQALPTLRKLTEDLQALQASISRLQNSQQFNAADLKSAELKLRELQEHAAALKREKNAKAPNLSQLEKQIAERQKRIDAVAKKINDATDTFFEGFSKKVGVKNIREYEESHLKDAERYAEQKARLTGQIARVKNQLEYDRNALELSKAPEKEKELASQKAQLEKLKSERQAHDSSKQSILADIEALSAQSSELKALIEEADAHYREIKKDCAAREEEKKKVQRGVQHAKVSLEQLKAQRDEIASAALMDRIVLPVKSSGNVQGVASRRSRGEVEGDTEDMDIDGNLDPTSDDDRVRLDYSGLSEREKASAPAAKAALDAEYRATIDEIRGQLSRLAPNLKAVEQYKAIREKETEQLEELEAARREHRTAAAAFATVRMRRYDLFTAALDHVKGCVDAIYKELTRSSVHITGGHAYLQSDNSEEPYLHGMKFSAMPPTKSFRDMEQLSGGEKTVAALALLFALHSFQPAPFFVLDEVDAALDATNVIRVANYIRAMTRPGKQGGFQGIVISLKDAFYEKSDALVGVTKDVDRGSSECYTFDLNRFGPATP